MSRSKAMKEQLEMPISFDTPLGDIETLRKEMETFVRDSENSRDFQPDVIVECAGVGNMDKLQLKVEIRHKSNWSNETVRASRRSKFMCALVLALRRVPIYPPGGGGFPLGDPRNPSYSVAVSDEIATESRNKAAKDKEAKRLIPSKPATSLSVVASRNERDQLGSSMNPNIEGGAANALNSRRPTDNEANNDWFDGKDDGAIPGLCDVSLDESLDQARSNDIDILRESLLKRESTRGRRRPGERAPSLSTGSGGPSVILTQPSPKADGFDEEANLGMTADSKLRIGRSAPKARDRRAPSYTMFPQSGLQSSQSASITFQPLSTRGPSIDQKRS